MNGNRYILDTNAILYILNGNAALADLLYQELLFISVITEIELLSYENISPTEEDTVRQFIRTFSKIDLENPVKEKCIAVRRSYGLKVPDSIIAASAICYNLPLVTSDKQFKKIKELELIYFEV